MKKIVWFKAKKYGWGWYPSTWQGWSILGLYMAFILYRASQLSQVDVEWKYHEPFTLEFIISTLFLIILCFITGEKPRWRWGD